MSTYVARPTVPLTATVSTGPDAYKQSAPESIRSHKAPQNLRAGSCKTWLLRVRQITSKYINIMAIPPIGGSCPSQLFT